MSNSPQYDLVDVRTEGEAQTGIGLPEDGLWSSTRLIASADAHPVILWKDKILQADLWLRGENTYIILYCPKCLHMLRIESARKKIEWDAEKGLHVEPFGCTWELADSDGREGERIIGGLNLCRWTVGIEPVTRVVDVDGKRMRVHGVAKGA